MAAESEKRVATLAVSRFGADRVQVHLALKTVLEARAKGDTGSLVELLLERKILTPAQAEEIRTDPAQTRLDIPADGAMPSSATKTSSHAPKAHATAKR